MDIFRWLTQQWDRTVAAVLSIAGLVALFLGWNGLSHVALPSQQIPYLASGGLLGLFALGASATLWLSADLRDEWRELHNIESKLSELCKIVSQVGGSEAASEPTPIEAGTNGAGNGRRPAAPGRGRLRVDRGEDAGADV